MSPRWVRGGGGGGHGELRECPRELVIMCGLSERHRPSESDFFLVTLEGSSRTRGGMFEESSF